jgi:hypothetical protein
MRASLYDFNENNDLVLKLWMRAGCFVSGSLKSSPKKPIIKCISDICRLLEAKALVLNSSKPRKACIKATISIEIK